jgi:hypothetical protein
MAVRAAGPNVLKDTTLCGTTTIIDPIDGCARPIWAAAEVSLYAPRPFVETPNQTINFNHQINADQTQSFQVEVKYSQDNINESYPLTFSGSNSAVRSIAITNTSDKDLLLRATLDIDFIDTAEFPSADPPRSYKFMFAITAPTFDIVTQQFETKTVATVGDSIGLGRASFSSILTLPAGARLQPLWNPAQEPNTMSWNSINCLFEIVGCEPQTNTTIATITGSGPGGGGGGGNT